MMLIARNFLCLRLPLEGGQSSPVPFGQREAVRIPPARSTRRCELLKYASNKEEKANIGPTSRFFADLRSFFL
jgi:hypothetical protein